MESVSEAAGRDFAGLIHKKSGPKNSGMTTGFLGTKPLLPVLANTAQLELAATIPPTPPPNSSYRNARLGAALPLVAKHARLHPAHIGLK